MIFGVAVYTVMKVMGCKRETAVRKVQCFIANKPEDPIYGNSLLVARIYQIICGVIGESRFRNRMRLNGLMPIVWFLNDWCPPAIRITIAYKDDGERDLLENLIKREVKMILKSYGLYVDVLASWEKDEKLKMPVLLIRYAVNADQREAWMSLFREEAKAYVAQNCQPLFDSEADLL